MLGGRRKLLNLAAEQGVNPFLSSSLKKKIKIWRRRMIGTKCTNWILHKFWDPSRMNVRDEDVLQKRQKMKYKTNSYGSVTENIAVMFCF